MTKFNRIEISALRWIVIVCHCSFLLNPSIFKEMDVLVTLSVIALVMNGAAVYAYEAYCGESGPVAVTRGRSSVYDSHVWRLQHFCRMFSLLLMPLCHTGSFHWERSIGSTWLETNSCLMYGGFSWSCEISIAPAETLMTYKEHRIIEISLNQKGQLWYVWFLCTRKTQHSKLVMHPCIESKCDDVWV